MEATIPALGGSYQTTATLVNQGTKLLLVRPKSFEPKRAGGTARVENVSASMGEAVKKVRVEDRVAVPVEGPQLEAAKVSPAAGADSLG